MHLKSGSGESGGLAAALDGEISPVSHAKKEEGDMDFRILNGFAGL
jgi:hypothetical protein